MKQTQYQLILNALRKAGNKGCTIRELQAYSNYPWSRIRELCVSDYGWPAWVKIWYGGWTNKDGYAGEYIERHERQHNGRTIRVYVLKRVK